VPCSNVFGRKALDRQPVDHNPRPRLPYRVGNQVVAERSHAVLQIEQPLHARLTALEVPACHGFVLAGFAAPLTTIPETPEAKIAASMRRISFERPINGHDTRTHRSLRASAAPRRATADIGAISNALLVTGSTARSGPAARLALWPEPTVIRQLPLIEFSATGTSVSDIVRPAKHSSARQTAIRYSEAATRVYN
jgi:hypothetical protein